MYRDKVLTPGGGGTDVGDHPLKEAAVTVRCSPASQLPQQQSEALREKRRPDREGLRRWWEKHRTKEDPEKETEAGQSSPERTEQNGSEDIPVSNYSTCKRTKFYIRKCGGTDK